MANYNLTGQKIKNTYGQVAQVNDSNKLVDGLGNEKQIVTASIVNFPTEVSRSAAEAGFGGGGTFDTSSLVQDSTFNAYTSSNDSAVSVLDTRVDSLTAATSSYLTSLPSGLVSGSSQISYSGITDVPSDIVSGAAQLPQIGINETDIASLTAQTSSYLTSADISGKLDTSVFNTYTSSNDSSVSTNTSNIASLTAQTSSYLTSLPSGVVSGSSQVDLSQATGVAANATSASYAVTASYALNGGASAGLVSGTGPDSMKSSDDLTSTQASATNTSSIAIGNGAEVGGRYGIAIGDGAGETGTQDTTIAIGANAHYGDSYGIGIGGNAFGGYQGVGIGFGANGSGYGVAIGASANSNGDSAIAIGRNVTANNTGGINIGGKFQYNDDGNGEIKLGGAVRVATSTLSITSNTASVDGGSSNYFYLNNAGGSNLLQTPTNIQDGATYTFKIDDGRNLTFSPAYKWPNGVLPTMTSGSDVISFVSIGGTFLYGTAQYNYQ